MLLGTCGKESILLVKRLWTLFFLYFKSIRSQKQYLITKVLWENAGKLLCIPLWVTNKVFKLDLNKQLIGWKLKIKQKYFQILNKTTPKILPRHTYTQINLHTHINIHAHTNTFTNTHRRAFCHFYGSANVQECLYLFFI